MARRTAGRGAQRLVVDWPRCDGHGLCAEVLPELVSLDEWGYPVVADGQVPDHLRRDAARARDACPAVALRLDRVTAPPRPRDPSTAPTRDDAET
ncbi:MAG TPA: ferredoxin [Actinomycetes bacterium]|nr:ferredoxin [Actinomycetes bacterium]